MIDLSGLTDVKVGDQLLAVDATGKRRALLQVRQVRGQRAIADITRGQTEVGHQLQARAARPTQMSRPVQPSDEKSEASDDSLTARQRLLQQRRKNGPAWGLTANLHQTTMDVEFRVAPTNRVASASMSGSSFGLGGFYDHPLTPEFQIRAFSGLEQVKAAGSTENTDCGNGTTRDCNFDVNYLSVGAQARYLFGEGDTKFWIGGGGAFFLAMSKSSNVLDTSQISTNQVYFLSGGVDIGITRDSFIPLSLDYGMFPPSDTVKAGLITMKVGYGWSF